MRISPSPRARQSKWNLAILAVGIAMLFSAMPQVVLGAPVSPATAHASTPTSATASSLPTLTLPSALGPARPLANSYGNSSLYTSDNSTYGNEGLNFSVDTGSYATVLSLPIALPSGGNLTVMAGELVNASDFGSAYVGFNAVNTGSGTVIHPIAVLTNGSYVMGTATLTPGGAGSLTSWDFRIVHTHADWWSFKFDSQLIIPTTGGNGTYNLTVPVAAGTESFRGHVSGASVDIRQEMIGSTSGLPFTSGEFSVLLRPALESNTSTTPNYAVDDGIYRAAGTAAYSTPMFGENQSSASGFSIPGDLVLVNPESPISTYATTTNDACLWGPCPPGGVSVTTHPNKAWLGAYTTDPAYTNVSGARLGLVAPSVLPAADQVLFNGIIIPVNGTTELSLGFADVNLTFGTISFKGVYPLLSVYNVYSFQVYALYANENAVTGGTQYVLQITRNDSGSAGWWNVWLNSNMLNSGWVNDTEAAYPNGSFDIGASALMADNERTPWAEPISGSRLGVGGISAPAVNTTAPLLAFFGNNSQYDNNLSLALNGSQGWGVPQQGLAWSWLKQQEVEFGASQYSIPWMPAGSVTVANATWGSTTHAISVPLANGTTLWTTMQATATVSPGTIDGASTAADGGSAALTVSLSFSGSPVTGASITSCTDSLALGTCGTFKAGGTAGTYTAAFTADKDPRATLTDTISFTAFSTTYGTGSGSVTVMVGPGVNLTSNTVQGGASIASVLPGGSVTVNIWANSSSGPTNAGNPYVSVPTALGTGCSTPTQVSTGFYTCAVTISSTTSLSGDQTISVATTNTNGVNLATTSVQVNVKPLPLTIGALTFSPANTPATGYTAGAYVNISVTATATAGPVAGVSVTFTFTPAVPSWSSGSASGTISTLGPVMTASNGVATVMLRMPTALASQQSYQVSAQGSISGYTITQPTAVSFTVNAPTAPSSGGSGSSGLLSNSTLLYALVGVVVLVVVVLLVVMMMRKKKSGGGEAPQQWTGAQAPVAEGAPAPGMMEAPQEPQG